MSKSKSGEWLAAAVKSIKESGVRSTAELKSILTTSGIGDAISPPEHASWFFDLLAARSVGLQSGFTVVETDKNELKVPRLTADIAANFTAEGSAITASDTTGDLLTATPRKIAALEVITSEAWSDSTPTALAITEHSMVRKISLGLDLAFFTGDGSAPNPRGLKNVASIQTVSMGTNGAALTNLDQFAEAIGLLETENAMPTAIAMHPRDWKALLKLKEQTSGNNKPLLQEEAGGPTAPVKRSIYGVPVYLSSQLPITEVQGTSGAIASSAYVYEAEQLVAVRRQDTTVEVDPYYDFASDKVGVRGIARWDLLAPNAKAIVRILGIIP